MTVVNWKDIIVVIDNASATTARITPSVNSHAIRGALNMLDHTGFGVANPAALPGLHQVTIPLNGWVDSTTRPIFSPLANAGTSITKTVGIKDGTKWHKGEFWPENVQLSGTPGELEMWSCDLRSDGALTYNTTGPT